MGDFNKDTLKKDLETYFDKFMNLQGKELSHNVSVEDGVSFNILDSGTLEISTTIDGDWKHDHARFEYLVSEFCKGNSLHRISHHKKEIGESDSDWYKAHHDFLICGDLTKLNPRTWFEKAEADFLKEDKEVYEKTHGNIKKDESSNNLSFSDVREKVGDETIITEIEKWLPSDDLDKMTQDIANDYDIGFNEKTGETEKTDFETLKEQIDAKQLVDEVEKWLSSDKAQDFANDVAKDYDLDFEEEEPEL